MYQLEPTAVTRRIVVLIAALVATAFVGLQPSLSWAEPSREAQAHKAEGDRLAGAGNLEAAMQAYRAALELEPRFALARNELGAVLFRLRRVPEAVTEFEQAVGLDPEYATAWFNLAFASRRLENWEQAARAYRKHTELRPAEAEAWHGLAESLLSLGRKAEAADAFEAYAERENRPARAERASQSRARATELRAEAERARAESEAEAAREREAQMAAAREREVAEAREREARQPSGSDRAAGEEPRPLGRRGAAEPAPGSVADEIRRGDELLLAEDVAGAEAAYSRALGREPGNVEALYKKAFADARMGRHSEAIAGWERVIELQPDNVGARRNIEMTRERPQTGRPEPAGLARAEEPTPAARQVDRAGAREAYQDGVRLMGEVKYEEAIAVFDQAIAKDPSLAQALVAKGSCYVGLRRYQDARREYEAALRVRPDMASPLFGLGEVHRALGETDLAKGYYQRYLDSRASDVDPNLTEQARRWVSRL